MFSQVYTRLAPTAALLIADLVEPQTPQARDLFASAWDASVTATSLHAAFLESQWNYYRYPHPIDHPSPLFDQLTWMKEAGFHPVDCFWLDAGHAVYGGYKGATAEIPPRFDEALALVHEILQVT